MKVGLAELRQEINAPLNKLRGEMNSETRKKVREFYNKKRCEL